MKYEIKKVALDSLFAAPWNPRPEITDESVKDLAANLSKKGQLHNIGVWLDPESGLNIVVYGNRRVVAARIAGWKEIVAFVYTECTELEAREMTRTENELRLGIDPLEDARQLKAMRDMGLNENEISAQYGVPIATVCRRLKLVDLAQSVRDIVCKGVNITTDALEKLSAYPVEMQDEVVKSCVRDGEHDRTYGWGAFEYKVNELTLNLDSGMKFDDCVSCPLRTGATPDLFGEIDEHGLGRCLNPSCHKRHRDDVIRKKVAEAIDPSVSERVKLKYCYQLFGCEAKKDRPDQKNTCAYYVVEADGNVTVKYGPSKAEKQDIAKQKKEEAKKESERIEAEHKLLQGICKKVSEWCKSNLSSEIKKYCGKDGWKIIDVIIRFNVNIPDWQFEHEKFWSDWTRRRDFANWFKLYSSFFDRFEDCQINEARRIVMFFNDFKWSDVLTKEELATIKLKKYA